MHWPGGVSPARGWMCFATNAKPDDPILGLVNTVLSPHNAGQTPEVRRTDCCSRLKTWSAFGRSPDQRRGAEYLKHYWGWSVEQIYGAIQSNVIHACVVCRDRFGVIGDVTPHSAMSRSFAPSPMPMICSRFMPSDSLTRNSSSCLASALTMRRRSLR